MGLLGRIIDHFKSDEQLMAEEQALFAKVIEHDERQEAGSELPPLDKSTYRRQGEKLKTLVHRGHRTDDQGGWLY